MSQPGRRTIAEATLVAGCMVALLIVVFDHRDELAPWAIAAGVLCAVVQAGALPLRHTRRRTAAAVALLAAAGLQLACPPELMPFAAYIAVGSLAAHLPPSRSWWGLAGLLALAALTQLPAPDGVTGTATVDQALFLAVVAVGIHVYGDLRRNRAARQVEQARRLVAQEQARIARELHDVVAHSVAVIVVQASAAGDVFDERPERARESLAAIEATARDALGELRRLVGAIRTEDDGGGASAGLRTAPASSPSAAASAGVSVDRPPIPLAPQPGLNDLPALVARVRATGLEVTVTRTGAAVPVPAGVELSAYRIVQEALTNTLRHARATRAEVVVRATPAAVELDVRDDGGPCPDGAARDGHGTTGMRERVELLGGTVEAGPCADGGGYRVRAHLPLGATAPLPGAAA